LKLNGKHQPLVYVDDVNILSGSIRTAKKSTDAVVVVCMETGFEVNADKIKYMMMSRD